MKIFTLIVLYLFFVFIDITIADIQNQEWDDYMVLYQDVIRLEKKRLSLSKFVYYDNKKHIGFDKIIVLVDQIGKKWIFKKNGGLVSFAYDMSVLLDVNVPRAFNLEYNYSLIEFIEGFCDDYSVFDFKFSDEAVLDMLKIEVLIYLLDYDDLHLGNNIFIVNNNKVEKIYQIDLDTIILRFNRRDMSVVDYEKTLVFDYSDMNLLDEMLNDSRNDGIINNITVYAFWDKVKGDIINRQSENILKYLAFVESMPDVFFENVLKHHISDTPESCGLKNKISIFLAARKKDIMQKFITYYKWRREYNSKIIAIEHDFSKIDREYFNEQYSKLNNRKNNLLNEINKLLRVDKDKKENYKQINILVENRVMLDKFIRIMPFFSSRLIDIINIFMDLIRLKITEIVN